MHAITSLIPLLPLALALPHTRQVAHEFDITELHGTFPTSGPYGTGPIDSSLSITLTYPSPDAAATTLTTTCSYAWPASIAPGPTDWTPCADDASVQWRLPADGWTSSGSYRVEIYQTLTADGAGLYAAHNLVVAPGMPSNPDAYLSCLQMGKFNPSICQLNGPLSALPGPVVMSASEESVRPE